MPNPNPNAPLAQPYAPDHLKKYVVAKLVEELQAQRAAELHHLMNRRMLNKQSLAELRSQESTVEVGKLREQVERIKQDQDRSFGNDPVSTVYAIWILAAQIGRVVESWHLTGQVVDVADQIVGKLLGSASATELFYKMLDERSYEEPPQKVLPKLPVHVKINEDGELEYNSLKEVKGTNGKPLFSADEVGRALHQQMERHFDKAIKDWLTQRGYETLKAQENGKEVDTGLYVDQHTQEPLTPEEFEKLKLSEDEPELSLATYLEKTFGGLEFIATPSSPTP